MGAHGEGGVFSQLYRSCLLCVYHVFLLVIVMMVRVRDLRSQLLDSLRDRNREIRSLVRDKKTA